MIWKQAYGFTHYEVSSEGHVRTLHKNRLLKPFTNKGGYSVLSLRKDNKSITIKVHTLVLEAFVCPRPTPEYVADHINRIRSDNRVENLRWATVYDNVINNSVGISAVNKAKSKCHRGHEFNETNTRIDRSPHGRHIRRTCKICEAISHGSGSHHPDPSKRFISRIGEHNSHAKLTEKQVLEIRSKTSLMHTELAIMFNVKPQTIKDIRVRRTWKHI